MVVVVMGVAGCGKTVIGEGLAKALDWKFCDADSLHPASNVEKMGHGIPLTDADRLPWLKSVARVMDRWVEEGIGGVMACSSLKQSYRDILQGEHTDEIKFAYLKGSFELFEKRLAQRKHHFMKSDMLKSQFATLEEPTDAFVVDASQPVEAVIGQLSSDVKIAVSAGGRG